MEDKEKIDAGFSAMLEKEQAELDQAVKEYFRGHWPDLSTEEGRNTPMTFTPFAVMRLAKHFYGLGKRARNPELSEISEKYAEKLDISKGWFDGGEIDGLIYESFIAGAEWQYQKDRGEFAKIKAKTWCEGFDAHKEQMLKDAVEADVNVYRDLAEGGSWAEFVVRMPTENLGDKVKIVIVPDKE